jgi:hypothetical protein
MVLTIISTIAGEGFVTVQIGPDQKKYQLHKALLTHHSEYFHAALKSSWKEGAEGIVKLDDIDPLAFDIFIDWMYTEKIPDAEEWAEEHEEDTEDPPDDNTHIITLRKAYVFGDRFLALKFKEAVHNYVVDNVLEYGAYASWFTAAQYAFDSLGKDHRFVEFLVDMICKYWNGFDQKGSLESCSQSFNIYLIKRYSWHVRWAGWGNGGGDINDYHFHELKPCEHHEHSVEENKK